MNERVSVWANACCVELSVQQAGQSYDYTAEAVCAQPETLRTAHLSPDAPPLITVGCADQGQMKAALQAYAAVYQPVATGGGIVRRGDSLLVIERRGMWDLPKGKLDPNENPQAAAVREIEEETGVTELQYCGDLPCTWHIYSEKGKMMFKTGWWYVFETDYAGPLSPQLEEDITEVAWVPIASIDPDALDTWDNIRLLLRAFFERYLES